MKDLNWRPFEQCHIDSCLVMMYKITYNLVAIPASEYLICNTKSSAHNHPLAYQQILTRTDYYKYTSTIIHWNALLVSIVTLPSEVPLLAQFSSAANLVVHVSP